MVTKRVGPGVRRDLGVDGQLQIHALQNRLDDPVGVFDLGQVVLDVADADEARRLRHEEWRGGEFLGAVEERFGDAIAHLGRLQRQPAFLFLGQQFGRNDVHQERWNSDVGQMRGDLRAHVARPNDGGFSYSQHKFI